MSTAHTNSLTIKNTSIAIAASALVALVSANPANAQLKRVTVGTNTAGTLYNQIGTAVSKLIQKETGIPSSARPFAGTSVYLPRLHRGEIELGMNSALDSGIAFQGQDEYKRPLTKIRGVTMIARAYYGFYVKANSGLKTVADLKGKSTIMSYRAIASFDRVNQAIIATGGLTLKDVDAVTVSGIPETIRALVDGRVVAGGTITGFPALREANAKVSGGLKLLALGKNEQPIKDLVGFEPVNIKPGPAFVGVSGPMTATRFSVFLNTGAHLSNEDVYKFAQIVHQKWNVMREEIRALRSIQANELATLNFGHPYHEGAVRYFKEAGLWTPAHEKKQSALLKKEK